MSKTFGNFTDFLDFSRNTTATFLGSDGLIQTAAADTPRIEYATDGTVRGLLIEEARTNLLTYSEDFTNAAWLADSSVVITSSVSVSPDGTQSADEVELIDGGDYIYDLTTVSASTEYTFSWYLKAGTATAHVYGLYDDSNANWITQTEYTITDGEDVGNGWYRISKTFTTPAGCTSLRVYPLRTTASGVVAGSFGTSFLWGAQLEEGSFATSYIPTSGATATRSADIASIAVENFGYNQDEGTVVVEASSQGSDGSDFPRLFSVNDGSVNNLWDLYISNTNVPFMQNRIDGSTVVAATIGSFSTDTFIKYATTLSSGDLSSVINGGTVYSDSSGTAFNATQIDLGHRNSFFYLNGHIRDFQYYPRRLTNRQLQEVTGATNTYDYTTVEAGTITRSPVATGSDLVAYSNFSTTNYFEQPHNSDLNFGTGDFCVMGWFKGTDSYGVFVTKSSGNSNGIFCAITINPSPAGYHFRVGPNTLESSASGAIVSDSWVHVAFVKSSSNIYIYENGVQISTEANTENADTTEPLVFGYRPWDNQQNYSGSMALWRISATAPTAEQIAKIYEDEKVLFQENAQATLYGSSDAVTALAHDDVTNLLHVGTSAGRSVFQGLRRVENTTDAVGTAISANNGLVVEE